MLFKTSCVSSLVAISGLLTMPNMAQARDIESDRDYRDYCSPAAYQYGIQSSDCDRYKSIYEDKNIQELTPTTEESTQKKIRQDNVHGYIGATIGGFFPDGGSFAADLNTALGISLYGGVKFNRYIATDIEIAALGGTIDDSDIDYGVAALFINPKFMLPLNDRDRGAFLFFSPGIGVSQANTNFDIDDLQVALFDDTRFTWQVKAGISLPVSKRLSTFGQIRYASQTEEDTVDFFGTEIGLNLDI